MSGVRFVGPVAGWLDTAHAHHRAREPEAAISLCDRILARAPGHVNALCLRGNLHAEQGRFEAALADFTTAAAEAPEAASIRILCARALAQLGRFAESWAQLQPLYANGQIDQPLAAHVLRQQLFVCDWSNLAALRMAAERDLELGRPGTLHFLEIALGHSRAMQLRCGQALAAPFSQPAPPRRARAAGGRIRLAYLSADLHAHATSFLMAELFELHSRDRFEVIAVSYGQPSDEPIRARLRAGFDQFIDVADQSDTAVADLITTLKVDIAIDLKGHTDGNRNGILAGRPAPVQVAYLGYPATSGADWIDYLLADEVLVPHPHFADYSEKIVWLPDSYQVNDRQRPIGVSGSRTDHGLPECGFVFACLNDAFKIQPEIFDIWMRLLHATPGSVLWLLAEDPICQGHLRHEASLRDVDPTRLVFAPRVDLGTHIARMQCADLFLDTSPCNAHTTASDALWAGLPLLTVLGQTFTGRVGASLLHAAGLPELITESLTDYESLALRLATDQGLLSSLRQRLVANRDSCALFDTPRFRDHLEAAYQIMWDRHCAGLKPEHFAVPAISPG